MSLFTNAFDPAMEEWGRIAGEPFTFGASTFTALSVEEITVEVRAMLGGRYREAHSRMLLSAAVLAASALVKGSIVTVRGVRLRMSAEPERDGTGSLWIPLGPVQIEPPDL